jgi:type VI secretion system secreted protein Hcp
MAVNAFITFESVTPGSGPAAFEIKDFSFGIENPTTIGSATGGAGAGKVTFNEFTIKKVSDQSSPAFFRTCCAGAHYKSVTVSMRKASSDAAAKEFLAFKFDTVFTTRIDWSGPGDEGPEESITFVYGKLGIRVIPASGAKPLVAGWDQVTNKAADDFAAS